jgi:hypothetical protein
MSRKNYFLAGIVGAIAFGATANIPMSGSPSGSTAVVPEVSEIRAKRHEELSFDNDLKRLSAMQARYHENLPRRTKKTQAPRKAKAPAKPGVAQLGKRHAPSRG